MDPATCVHGPGRDEGATVTGDASVAGSESSGPDPVDQLKLWPQPQVRLAFGFVMANPDWSRPSL